MAPMTVPAASGEKDTDKDYHLERASHLWDDPELTGLLHRTLDQAAPLTAGAESARSLTLWNSGRAA
jgi:hypothetical protein